MVKAIARKIKPTKGYAHVLHIVFSAILPAIIYVLIRMDFVLLSVFVLLLTKWRTFTVRPRFWPAVIRANAVDLMVGLSTIVFMSHTATASTQLIWAGLYMVWQVFIKPGRQAITVIAQALIGQTYALMAIFLAWTDAPLILLIFAAWAACYLSARHFLSAFEEPYTSLYAHTWGYFAAALVWVSVHWLLFYGVVAQPTLLLTVLGFGFGGLYFLEETDKLSNFVWRQIVFIMVAVVVVVLLFSDWGDKTL